MNTYKTKDGIDRTLPGIGRTVNGQITTPFVIENRMFELVAEPAPQPAGAPAQQPSAGAQPAAPTTSNQETK